MRSLKIWKKKSYTAVPAKAHQHCVVRYLCSASSVCMGHLLGMSRLLGTSFGNVPCSRDICWGSENVPCAWGIFGNASCVRDIFLKCPVFLGHLLEMSRGLGTSFGNVPWTRDIFWKYIAVWSGHLLGMSRVPGPGNLLGIWNVPCARAIFWECPVCSGHLLEMCRGLGTSFGNILLEIWKCPVWSGHLLEMSHVFGTSYGKIPCVKYSFYEMLHRASFLFCAALLLVLKTNIFLVPSKGKSKMCFFLAVLKERPNFVEMSLIFAGESPL